MPDDPYRHVYCQPDCALWRTRETTYHGVTYGRCACDAPGHFERQCLPHGGHICTVPDDVRAMIGRKTT